MWCFVDESWPEPTDEHVGVLAGVVGPNEEFEQLGKVLYRVRKKYFGEENARSLKHELKGSQLFSNQSFRLAANGYSKNLSVAREIVEWAVTSRIRMAGITVYGSERPPLLSPNLKSLSRPFKELCVRVIAAIPPHHSGQLIFDQRLGAQEDISIAVCHYLSGMANPHKLIPYPCVGVSNVWPGLQLADIAAHILGRYAAGDNRFISWYRKIMQIQTVGEDHLARPVYGMVRMQWDGEDQFSLRKHRTKKELGTSEKEES